MSAVWLSIADVSRRVQRCDDIVRERMAETPPHIEKPWINVSTAKRPEWRFENEAAIDKWWKEVHLWRAGADSQAENTKSAGATPTGPLAPNPRRRRALGTSSSTTSPTAKSDASDTSPGPNMKSLGFLRSVKA